MACTSQELVEASVCYCSLNVKQLLQAILYVTCINGGGMACDAQTLLEASKCLCGMSEKQLLQAILFTTCNGGGGGGGGAGQIVQYTTNPNDESLTPSTQSAPAIAYSADGTGPVFGWNTTTHVWE